MWVGVPRTRFLDLRDQPLEGVLLAVEDVRGDQLHVVQPGEHLGILGRGLVGQVDAGLLEAVRLVGDDDAGQRPQDGVLQGPAAAARARSSMLGWS